MTASPRPLSASPDSRQQAAIAGAGSALAQGRRDRDELAATGGAQAVAEAAGHEGADADRVAAHYAGLAKRAAQGLPPKVTDPAALEKAAAAYAAGRSGGKDDAA